MIPVLPVVLRSLAEVSRQVAEILRPLEERHAEACPERLGVGLAEAGEIDGIAVRRTERRLQVIGRQKGRDLDAERLDPPVETDRHPSESPFEGLLRELPRHEQQAPAAGNDARGSLSLLDAWTGF